MRISLIVAAAANRVIGADGRLPWHLPNDFRHFRETTMGKPIVMGRRTWASIGRPLPGRDNIVLTRQADLDAAGIRIAHSLADALRLAAGADEVMVIGGGDVYLQFFDIAGRIYYTHVDTNVDGDTTFPPLDDEQWVLTSSDSHAADERHAFAYEFRVYDRV